MEADYFQVPNSATRLAAIGLDCLKEQERPIFQPDPQFFDPILEPGYADWLYGPGRNESKQTFEGFALKAKKANPKHKIYLVLLGEFKEDRAPNVDILLEYANCFFSMSTVLLDKINVLKVSQNECSCQWRDNHYTITSRAQHQSTQLLTTDVHLVLSNIKQTLDDAFCVVAITMFDLYPKPDWNFVFGQASLLRQVGVFSFVRYDPAFEWDPKLIYSTLDPHQKVVLMLRASHVMVHEITHIFGVRHCCYFRCIMNGTNHLAELDSQPLYLCPMDLHKLHYVIGFDPMERYKNLLAFFQKYESYYEGEKVWVSDRLKKLQKIMNSVN